MKFKKTKLFFFVSLICFLGLLPYFSFANAKQNIAQIPDAAQDKIIFFWGQGCPHCAKVESYIQKNQLDKLFHIERKEIYFNKKNRDEFLDTCQKYNIPTEKSGVPLALVDGQCLIGDQPIIKALAAKAAKQGDTSSQTTKQTANQAERKNSHKLTLPLIISAAAVDAINPCAFAVLIILMTTILSSGQRKRALAAGICFATAIYISYLLMGLGIYRALATAKFSDWFMKIVGALAILLGFLNIKDYFWYGGGGFVMEVPMSWRPKMKALIHSVTSPIGALAIGFLVSLFLLPCTSGPYIVILGMLSQRETFFSALIWLLLYNFIFVLPMIAISLAAYRGLNPQKAEEARQKRLRLLHLIAGLLMLGMGLVILLRLV
jgi:cytochrome c biogenesis protein CcdA/glutaredoxin